MMFMSRHGGGRLLRAFAIASAYATKLRRDKSACQAQVGPLRLNMNFPYVTLH